MKAIEKEQEVVLKFPEVDALSPPILQLSEVTFGYSKDKIIFTDVSLNATLESRICIVSILKFPLGSVLGAESEQILWREIGLRCKMHK